MRHATSTGRLGLVAVGLGIGAALAATGTASANPAITSPPVDPTTLTAAVEGMTLGTPSADPAAVELPPFDPNNLAISIDGATVYEVGSATAISGRALGDIAIADGADSVAYSGNSSFDFGPFFPFDTAVAYGSNTFADAPGVLDTAGAFGTGSQAIAANIVGAACVLGPNADAEATGFFDYASIINTGSGFDQAVAGGESAIPPPQGFSNFDIASVVGTDSTAMAGGDGTNPGNFDLAAAFGDMLHAVATGGNFLVDIQP